MPDGEIRPDGARREYLPQPRLRQQSPRLLLLQANQWGTRQPPQKRLRRSRHQRQVRSRRHRKIRCHNLRRLHLDRRASEASSRRLRVWNAGRRAV